jgi:putative chitinase
MTTITLQQLKKIMIYAPEARLSLFLDPLNKAFIEFNINTPLRVCHFLAQIAHESGEFRYLKEIADGSAYDTGQRAIDLGNTPIADGDGQMYKGRGLIQVTGKYNYRVCGKALRIDLMSQPELLELPENAVRSAGWFWNLRNLSMYADKDLLEAITKKINGGYNGLADRKHYLLLAKKALSCL